MSTANLYAYQIFMEVQECAHLCVVEFLLACMIAINTVASAVLSKQDYDESTQGKEIQQ